MVDSHDCIQQQNIEHLKEDVKEFKGWQREQNGTLKEQSRDIKEIIEQVQEINNKITKIETARETEKQAEDKFRRDQEKAYTGVENTRGWIMMAITLASLLVAASSIIFT